MRVRGLWMGLVAIVSAIGIPAQGAEGPDGERWWSHVRVLADDKFEGRDTGSAGHRKAADYVAGEFRRLGLKPAGMEGFVQPVDFLSKTIDEAHSRLELVRSTGTEPLELGLDAIDPTSGRPGRDGRRRARIRRLRVRGPRSRTRRLSRSRCSWQGRRLSVERARGPARAAGLPRPVAG